MRIMGLDIGDKTIGVAVSDLMEWTAQGLEVIRRSDDDKDMEKLADIIKSYEVGKIVVGLPKNMNGTIGPQGEKVQDFAAKIKSKIGLPVELWDERLTTAAAERMLIEADVSRKKRKKVIDKVAAVLILQGYLDSIKLPSHE
ncbi:MAG: Holliday junction resolvase RuvX [Desulfotomaculum sp.]|nr:Holliday junction resolvase RuvX [Desulfotomaculum sp.]